ncbi:MAG TPA: D-sedoheptulose 7-phosphate isomerase [Burkholderiaceae bacterium]
MTTALLHRYLAGHRVVFDTIEGLAGEIATVAERLAQCLRDGGKILLCGNGGSAADCQHLAAEFTGRFNEERAPLAALALTTDSSALTCIGNDYGFEHVFARQVQALGRPGDCLVGISTSGRSVNVLRAMTLARERGLSTIGLLGRDGGDIAPLCDLAVIVPGTDTARLQEAHLFIEHAWCALVEHALSEQPPKQGSLHAHRHDQ